MPRDDEKLNINSSSRAKKVEHQIGIISVFASSHCLFVSAFLSAKFARL
jgi:hypothetical protein